MKVRLARIAAVAAVVFATAATSAFARLETLRIANYNVENLFDATVNSPTNPLTGEPGDAEWSASSWRRWTEARYRTKLAKLAWVVDKMKPDILVVEEVENAAVCKALADEIERTYHWSIPHLAHRESPDPRGIDVAILSRYPVKKVSYSAKTGRRGLLAADLEVDGTVVTVFANHWKSQIGNAKENARVRGDEAAKLREAMLARLKADPDAVLVALGDFNENMDGPAMAESLRAAGDRDEALSSLHGDFSSIKFFNLVGDIPEKERGTYFYARWKTWNTLDGIVVQPRMLLPASSGGPAWRAGAPGETAAFKLPQMQWGSDGRPNAFRRMRKYEAGSSGGKVADEGAYTDGYSDHFPLLTVLHRASD